MLFSIVLNIFWEKEKLIKPHKLNPVEPGAIFIGAITFFFYHITVVCAILEKR